MTEIEESVEEVLKTEPIHTPYKGMRIVIQGSDDDPVVIRQKKWAIAFMASTVGYSVLSHCSRHKVACMIVKDRRPMATGINGTSPGAVNCDEVFTNPPAPGTKGYDEYLKAHIEFSEQNEQHAEANAISWCGRKGIEIEGSHIYTTLSPCLACAKLIVPAGIIRCYYLEKYDRDPGGLDYLMDHGVEVVQLKLREVQAHIVAIQDKLNQAGANRFNNIRF